MVNEEELKVLKLIGDEAKAKNLWLKVYCDKTKRDGLVSVADIIQTVLDEFASLEKGEVKKK